MTLNQAEIDFFKLREQELQNNPVKPIQDLSLEEYRELVSVFSEYTGEPENVNYKDTTITSRDGFSTAYFFATFLP